MAAECQASLFLGSFHSKGLRVADVNPLLVTRKENIGALNLLLALGCDNGEGGTVQAQAPAQAEDACIGMQIRACVRQVALKCSIC